MGAPRIVLISLIACLVAVTLPSDRARATEGAPLDVRLVARDPGRIPAPGEVLRATLELSSQAEVLVTQVAVRSGRDGSGALHWDTQLLDVPTDVLLVPGVTQSFAVELVANDPTQSFDIALRVGDRIESQSFFVIEPSVLAGQTLPAGLPVIGAPTRTFSPPLGDDPEIDLNVLPPPFPFTEGMVLHDEDVPRAMDADVRTEKNSLLLTVRGELVVRRDDNQLVAVDGATVLVFDSDYDGDDFLGSGVTKADGSFEFTVLRGDEAGPEVYLLFLAANGVMDVKYSGLAGFIDSDQTTWRFTSDTKPNMTSPSAFFGTVQPPTSTLFDLDAPFYIGSIVTKAWRYVGGLGYSSGLDRVRITWPNDVDPPFYRRSSKTIFMNTDRQWNEATMVHEFGHHWINEYGSSESPQYCNPGGYRDDGDDCGHTSWCAENQDVAWSEGFPNFLVHMTHDWITANYHSVVNTRTYEWIAPCDEAGFVTNPLTTHGILSALMRDLADANAEADTVFTLGGEDRLAQGASAVLATAASAFGPRSSIGFLNSHFALNPSLGQDYWFTAANNGYDLDQDPPSAPTNPSSTSHVLFGNSADGTVQLSWTAATDDISGIRRYHVRAAATPTYPFAADSFSTTSTSITTPELGPGTWYLTVAAEDWSGKTSVNYATYGPISVREPEPAEFALAAGRAWPLEVVPRKTDDTSSTFAPLPDFLPGDQPQTYLNYRVENRGELENPVLVTNYYWVDGELLGINTIPQTVPLGGGASRVFVNQGPFVVRGGRHMVEVQTDVLEVLPESDEANNRTARQFVWAPTILVTDPVVRAAPPDPFVGFGSVTPLSSPNCDGLAYFAVNAPFTGIAVVPDEAGDDPDLRSHPHTTGPQNGFDLISTLASSSRGRGAVDAVITNTALTSELLIDVGIRSPFMNGDVRATPLASTEIPTVTPTPVTFDTGEYLSLHHFTLSTNFGTDHATVRVEIDPATEESLWVAIIEPDVAHFGLDDATLVQRTLRAGVATIDFTYTQPLHGLVLYRDRPTDGSEAGPLTATVTVEPTPANFVAATGLAGWTAPVAPTNGAPGTSSNVPAPSTLVGDAASTYVNVAIANESPNPGVPLEFVAYVDDVAVVGAQTSGIVGGGTLTRNFSSPISVRGGRHTLWAAYDGNDLVRESDEEDNLWGAQWIWTPSIVGTAPAIDFATPPDPIGGFDALALAQAPAFFNSVGLRDVAPLPSGDDGHWQGVVVMPGVTSDVDVRLHEATSGALDGFAAVRATSNWGVGSSDYVLTNFRAVSAKPMDVGVVAVQGTESFMAHAVRSTWLGSQPSGVFGDFVLFERDLLDLYEVELQAGLTSIELIAVDGNVDWGVTVHSGLVPYHSKALSPDSWSAFEAPAGVGESLVVDVPQDGRYAVAVWKGAAADAFVDGTYRLAFGDATDAPPAGPATRTALRSIQPNPFNPRTVVHFDVARESSVAIRVYDVSGALVRTLIDRRHAAGRHAVVWDGLDDRGRRVASGVYFVELRTPEVRATSKAVLLK